MRVIVVVVVVVLLVGVRTLLFYSAERCSVGNGDKFALALDSLYQGCVTPDL